MNLFEFDTRDKKPKLYSLLAASALAAAVISVLVSVDPVGNAGAACVTVAVYCLIAVIILLYSFREQIRYNPYSYNTVFYFGFALFALFVMVTHIILAVRIFRHPEVCDASGIIHSLLGSAVNYVFLTSPFLLIFCVCLCVSNISLIKHEGFRPVNLLGIALSVLIVGGEVFIFLFDYAATGSQTDVMIHDLIANLFAAMYLYFECMLLGTMVAGAITAPYEPSKDKDYIIILGCGLRKDGTPTPVLRARIDRALEFARRQEEETGKKAVFVTSGGKGSDERVSESLSMTRYLLEKGVPEDRILMEDRSTTTFENMKYSKEIIFARDPSAKIIYSTSAFHVFRSGIFARRMKMRAVGIGAKTKWYFWPNAAVREFADILTKHRIKQAVILGTMVAVYVALTVLAYTV